MPTPSDAAAEASRDGQTLRLTGALTRAHVPALWKRLPPLDGLRTLDLRQVASVDSAGLALLAEVAGRAGIDAIEGAPQGLAELRSAYRLDERLGFAAG
jgi:phospholipid transport system transporter-binding protein